MGVCVVTGGGGDGLGSGLSTVIAQRGHTVWVADIDEHAANDTADLIAKTGAVARPLVFDVSDHHAVESAFDHVIAVDGELTGLVNSAGVGLIKATAEVEPAEFDRLFGVDLRGTWLCCRAAIPRMTRSRGGSIVNIGSIHARNAASGYAVYAAAKAAVVGLSRGIAKDYGAYGIRCNVVHPGLVDSMQTRRLVAASGGDPEAWIRRFTHEGQILPTAVRAEDVGAAVAFLLGEEARAITGIEVTVDAGSSAMLSIPDLRTA